MECGGFSLDSLIIACVEPGAAPPPEFTAWFLFSYGSVDWDFSCDVHKPW